MNRKYMYIGFLSLILSLGTLWGQNTEKAEFDLSKNLTIYHNVLKELNLLYVDSVDNAKLINKGIESMLGELDPYTTYIPEKDMDDFKTQTTGEYGGIGALIGKKKDQIIIAEVYEGFPADKAGLKTGDVLLSIDGKDLKGAEVTDATEVLKGTANTSFVAKIMRPYAQKKELDIKVTREKISLDCVPYDTILDGNKGYILFTNFTTKAEECVKEAVKRLKKNGATSIILDMRGNPGGLLDQAIKVVNLFIPKNETVVSTNGRITQWDRSYQTTKNPVDTVIPVVVLINRGSASASEIVAGTIQDLDRGIIVGTNSFGKGLVQTTRDVGYNGRLKVTTSKYYIPSGRSIQALDYAHRNEDGSVGHIPDSLISAYKTRNGRTVYDGGGIMPDVKVTIDKYSSLTSQLVRDYKIFDFANWYAETHDKVDKDFVVNDVLYQKFVDFIDSTDFSYKSATFKAFEDLKKAIVDEKREEIEEMKHLETILQPKLKDDLMLYKKEITDLLTYEIMKRSLYQKGGYIQATQTDETIEKAIEILNDSAKYKGMLDGSIAVDSSVKQKQEKKE